MLWFGECHFGFIPALKREAFSLYFRNPTTARFLYHAPSSHGSGITPTETAPTSETAPRSTSALVGTSGMPESSAGVSPAASAVVAGDSRACTGAGSVERPARGRSRPKNGGEPNGVEPQWVGGGGKGVGGW